MNNAMQIFYTPQVNEVPELPEEESVHCVRVLRLGEGDEITLTDGKGCFYRAVITDANPKRCGFEVLEKHKQEPLWDFNLHIAVAPTKNIDRMEWFAEKATEIGIDAITFLNCRFSERRDIKLPRLEKIVVSAMKQSMKATLPALGGMTSFSEFVRRPFDGQKFIAHCQAGEKSILKDVCQPYGNILVMIGPEGDFSAEEIQEAQDSGFVPVSLGKSRLRTETAALVACHTIHVLAE